MCHIAFDKIALKNDRPLAIAISYLHYITKCELWSGKAPINRSTNHILRVLYHKHYGVGIVLPRHLSETLQNYSTNSVDTGARWIDEKTIFRQTFEVNTKAQGNIEQIIEVGLPKKPLQIIRVEGGIRAGVDFYPLEYINPNAPSGQNSQLKLTFYNGAWQVRFNTGSAGRLTITVYYTE